MKMWHCVVTVLCASSVLLGTAYSLDGVKSSVEEIRKRLAQQSGSQADADQSEARGDESAESSHRQCPDLAAVDLFKHEIAYERTGEAFLLKGLDVLNIYVWQQGPMTLFYVRNRLDGFLTDVRMTYSFG